MGRDPAAAAVDQPELTEGSWVHDGGAVVEAGFADALDVGEGDQITLRTRLCTSDAHRAARLPRRGRPLVPGRRCRRDRGDEALPGCVLRLVLPRVRRGHGGRTCSRSRRRLDRAGRAGQRGAFVQDPVEAGLVWLTEADARALAPAEDGLSYVVNLKLADPADAPAFVDAHPSSTTGRTGPGIVAGHQRRAPRLGGGPAESPADRQPAAGSARRGQRRRPRRRADGRPDPTRRAAQGGRRHTAPGRGRPPRRDPGPGPARGRRGASRPDGWPLPCSPTPVPASSAARVRRRSPCPPSVR